MWQLILGIGILFVLLEIFIPSMFFLNLALAAFVCAIAAYFISNIYFLVILFCLLSLTFIFTLRPLFINKTNKKDEKTGMENKYVGKIAKVVENVDKTNGVISIYDERWQARTLDNEIIETGNQVEIIGHDSLIMRVKKIN